jgi:hypothetical protein
MQFSLARGGLSGQTAACLVSIAEVAA